MWSIHPNQIVPIVEAMRPDFEVQVATEILVAAQAADWGRSGTMESFTTALLPLLLGTAAARTGHRLLIVGRGPRALRMKRLAPVPAQTMLCRYQPRLNGMETGMRKTLIATTLLLAAGFANVADAPPVKSGLWEMTNNMSGPQPMMTTTMQQCVDEKTDKLADQPGDMKQNCSKNDISRSGGKVIVDPSASSKARRRRRMRSSAATSAATTAATSRPPIARQCTA